MAHNDPEAALEAALIDLEEEDEGTGRLITGWIVVAEFVDANGEPVLRGFHRTGMPYWRIDGLLENADDVLTYEEDNEEL